MTPKRILIGIAAAVVIVVLCITGFVAYVGSVTLGVASIAKACGVDLLTPSNALAPASRDDLKPSPRTENSPKPPPGGEPKTVAAPTTDTSEAERYFVESSSYAENPAAMEAEKRKNAAIIVATVEARSENFSPRDTAITVGVAIQESGLFNNPGGDRDSLGLFQQRPSQGWGSPEQIMDPVYATNQFLDRLRNVPNRESMPMIEVGITIQRPDPYYYYRDWKWDTIATQIVAMYTGGQAPGAETASCAKAVGVSGGEWKSPLDPGSYCMLDPFGPRLHPIYGTYKLHSGVDLSCNANNPIYAVHSGTIIHAGGNGDLGQFVKIDHGDGTNTGYAHMIHGFADGITEGATVQAGQILGWVGTTGGSTGEHLHFMAWINGELTDPVPFMAERGVTLE